MGYNGVVDTICDVTFSTSLSSGCKHARFSRKKGEICLLMDLQTKHRNMNAYQVILVVIARLLLHVYGCISRQFLNKRSKMGVCVISLPCTTSFLVF